MLRPEVYLWRLLLQTSFGAFDETIKELSRVLRLLKFDTPRCRREIVRGMEVEEPPVLPWEALQEDWHARQLVNEKKAVGWPKDEAVLVGPPRSRSAAAWAEQLFEARYLEAVVNAAAVAVMATC